MAVVVADGSVWHVSSPQPEASAFWPAGLPSARRAARRRWLRPLPPSPTTGQKCLRWKSQAVPRPSGSGLMASCGTTGRKPQVARSGQAGNRSACPPASPSARRRWRHTRTSGSNCSPTLQTPMCGTGCCGQPPIPNSWSPWAPLPATGPQPGAMRLGVAADATGRLVLIGSAGYQVWHTAQTAADADTWTQWSKLAAVPGSSDATDGEKLGAPAVGFNQAGLVEIFVVDGTGGELYHLPQATGIGQLTLGPQTLRRRNSHLPRTTGVEVYRGSASTAGRSARPTGRRCEPPWPGPGRLAGPAVRSADPCDRGAAVAASIGRHN